MLERKWAIFVRAFAFLLILLVAACGGGSSSNTLPPTQPEKLSFTGMGSLGIFDPSLTEEPGSGRLWMSYSSVDPTSYATYNMPSVTYWQVEIRLAYSDDNGTTWQDAGSVAASNEVTVGPLTVGHPGGNVPASSEGIWQSETSSLIYDSGATVGEEWKLIWYHYLHADGRSLFADYQWVSLKMAATPQGLAAATPVKLFAGIGLQADNGNIGFPVFSPIAGAPAIQLNTDVTQSVGGADPAELNTCVFAEPALHATATAVYFTAHCADVSTIAMTGDVTEYIVHLRCVSPCDMSMASSWEYIGRLLSPVDAQAVSGDHHFSAPSLVEKNGNHYLIVTSVDKTTIDRYNGCYVFEFTDLDSNQLARSGGNLLEVATVDGEAGTHFGACDGFDGMNGGMLLSQVGTVGSADTFQIFKSQVSLP